jgi:hypothetical protein
MKFGFTENILLPKYTDNYHGYPSQKVSRLVSGSLAFGFGSLSGINYETDDTTTQGVTGNVTSSVSWSYYAILDQWANSNWEWEENPGTAASVYIGDDQEVYVVNSDNTYEWKHPSQLKVGDICYAIGRKKTENNEILQIVTGSTTDIVQLSGITHGFKRNPTSYSVDGQPAYLVRTSGSLS